MNIEPNEWKLKAMKDSFREWFEDLGHWRNLDPDATAVHDKFKKQTQNLKTKRKKLLHVIEYNEVKADHKNNDTFRIRQT